MVQLRRCVGLAAALGGIRWGSANWLSASLSRSGVPWLATGGGLLAAFLVLLLLASAACGVAAQVLGAVVERVWFGTWPRCAAPLTRWRQRRWQRAHQRFRAATEQDDLDGLAAARNRIGLLPPCRPTWMADRLRAADQRVWLEYGVDLSTCWSRLWLVIPDSTRQAVQLAREQHAAATALGGWAVLYALLGVLWWPAVVLGVVIGVTSWRRARATTAVLADLVEATVDVHAASLAVALGVPVTDNRVDRQTGLQVTQRCRKAS
jgi:hypothetical protein